MEYVWVEMHMIEWKKNERNYSKIKENIGKSSKIVKLMQVDMKTSLKEYLQIMLKKQEII